MVLHCLWAEDPWAMPPRTGLLWPHVQERTTAENLGKGIEWRGLLSIPLWDGALYP